MPAAACAALAPRALGFMPPPCNVACATLHGTLTFVDADMLVLPTEGEPGALSAVNPDAQPDFSAAYARHAAAGKASAAAAAGRTLVSGAENMDMHEVHRAVQVCPRDLVDETSQLRRAPKWRVWRAGGAAPASKSAAKRARKRAGAGSEQQEAAANTQADGMAEVTQGNTGRPAQLITSATLYGVLNLHLNDLDVRGLPSAAGVAQLSTANGNTTAAAAAAPPADAAPAAEAGSSGAADAAKRVRNLQKKLRQVRPWLTDTPHLGE